MMCRRIKQHIIYRYQNEEVLCLTNGKDREAEWVDIETTENACLEEVISEDEEDFRGLPAIGNIADWVISAWEEDKSRV